MAAKVVILYITSIPSINFCEVSKCLRNKVLKALGCVRNFIYLGDANITSKQKTDMAKVAIKNVESTGKCKIGLFV